MFKQILIATALTASLSSGVAIAQENPTPTVDTAAPAPASSAKTRYCLKMEPVTGSILQGRSCRTLEQWKKLGIDPTEKQD
jgi:hypothetical protein